MKAAKALIAAIGTVVTALSGALADDVFDGNDVAGLASTIVLAALTVYAVWKVPNTGTRAASTPVG